MRTILFINLSIILFMILSMYGCTEIQVRYLTTDLTPKLAEKSILPKVSKDKLDCRNNIVLTNQLSRYLNEDSANKIINALNESHVSCIDYATYTLILERQTLLKEDSTRCRALVETTKEKSPSDCESN